MKSSELLRILLQDNWWIDRQKGSHVILFHPEKKGSLVVPYHGAKEIRKRVCLKILRKAGLR